MKAEIIAVGTEILLGDIVNTNAQFLAKELASLGIDVYYQSVVGDNEERLLKCFEEGLSRSDIIITTGGLGPTKDDLTKEIASKYFEQELYLHQESLDKIQRFFDKMRIKMTDNNKKQAYFPKEAIILENHNGTAPGAILTKDNKYIVVLPGPPREMIPMFNEGVRPYLQNLTDNILVSKTLRLFGIGESTLEETIVDLIDRQTNPTIAPYAKEMEVTLRITAKANNEDEANKLINPLVEEIENRVGKYIYATGETKLSETVAKILVDKDMTIAVAESCTGGMVASSLIDYSGISKIFMEGCVTYSNEAKMSRLGVKENILNKYGAVSEETAIEMAQGIAKNLNTNIGLSTTGIAGPGGGSDEKPVGLVYVGLYINGVTKVKKFNFTGSRERIRMRSTKSALEFLRRELLNIQ